MIREILTEVLPGVVVLIMLGVFSLGTLGIMCHLYSALNEIREVITSELELGSWREVCTRRKMVEEQLTEREQEG